MNKAIIFVVGALFMSLYGPAHAHERDQPNCRYCSKTQVLTSDMIDEAKQCVYQSKLYSRGSVIRQEGRLYVCEKVSAGAEPYALGWDNE